MLSAEERWSRGRREGASRAVPASCAQVHMDAAVRPLGALRVLCHRRARRDRCARSRVGFPSYLFARVPFFLGVARVQALGREPRHPAGRALNRQRTLFSLCVRVEICTLGMCFCGGRMKGRVGAEGEKTARRGARRKGDPGSPGREKEERRRR